MLIRMTFITVTDDDEGAVAVDNDNQLVICLLSLATPTSQFKQNVSKSIYFIYIIIYIFRFLSAFKLTYRASREVGGAEAQMLPLQHTSYLSLHFVRQIYGFDSIIC